MIDYETWCRIRLLHDQSHLGFSQIARELDLDPQTVAKYARLDKFPRRSLTKRTSKLDPFKPAIIRWLEHHPYTATQIFQRLRSEEGYTGGLSIIKACVRTLRPVRRPAFLSLAFAPGEAAQVDWGCAGTIQIEFFDGIPGVILIDNLKTGVLSHPYGASTATPPSPPPSPTASSTTAKPSSSKAPATA